MKFHRRWINRMIARKVYYERQREAKIMDIETGKEKAVQEGLHEGVLPKKQRELGSVQKEQRMRNGSVQRGKKTL